MLTTFQHFFLSEHYPWKLVRREKAGFMCTLLMPLMCFPHHPLSNYFTKGHKVLASTKKRRTISTMYYMDFCEHSQRRVCAMFSLWANLPCTFFFLLYKKFDNNNKKTLHRWNRIPNSQTKYGHLLLIAQKTSAPNKAHVHKAASVFLWILHPPPLLLWSSEGRKYVLETWMHINYKLEKQKRLSCISWTQ